MPSAVQPGQIETALAALLLGAACAAAVKLTVTVVDPKTGKPVTTPRRVESAEYETGVVDVMLLLDTSLVGEMVARWPAISPPSLARRNRWRWSATTPRPA